MSSEFHHYTRDDFLAEFYPDPADKAASAAGMKQLRAGGDGGPRWGFR